MNLSQLKKGDRFYERSLIFCRQHVAISAPYMVAHMQVIDTINGPVSENTLVSSCDRFSLDPLPSMPLHKQGRVLAQQYIIGKPKMAKVTPETLLRTIPKQPHVSITLAALAQRFGCNRNAIAKSAAVLETEGKIEKFKVMGNDVHYRQKPAIVSVCNDLGTSV